MNKLISTIVTIITLCIICIGCEHSALKEVHHIEDLKHIRIGVPKGTSHEQYMNKHAEAHLKHFNDTMEAVRALIAGQVEGVVTNVAVAHAVVKHNPTLYVSTLEMDQDPVAVAVRKGNLELKNTVNKIITELEENGVLEDMKARWLTSDSVYSPVSIELPSEGNPLRIAVSATREPFCFRDVSGNICGFDIELACRIAQKMNCPLKFVDMKFPSLIAALKSGKADAIISLLNVTPERMCVVDFSVPYFNSDRVLLLKK